MLCCHSTPKPSYGGLRNLQGVRGPTDLSHRNVFTTSHQRMWINEIKGALGDPYHISQPQWDNYTYYEKAKFSVLLRL